MTETWKSGGDIHVIRQYIERGLCPVCGAGPFKVVASHTSWAHGVDKLALRAAAALPNSKSISSEEVRERRKALAAEHLTSDAGKRGRERRVQKYMDEHDCDRDTAIRLMVLESAKTRSDLYRTEVQDRDAAIAMWVRNHPDASFREVGAHFGISDGAVRTALRLRGVPARGRGAPRNTEQLTALGVAGRQAATERRRQPILDDWDASDKSVRTLENLAAKYGKRKHSMRTFLASHGRKPVSVRSVL